jgi:HlyD family secretion protein
MDRPIDPAFRRQKVIRRTLFAILGFAMVVLAVAAARSWITPSVSRKSIRTAIVDVGPVEATLTASGTAVPEFEQVLSSPIDARVLRILKRPGTQLHKGDAILELDVSQSVLALERLNEQLAIKENQQGQRKLELENKLIDLQGQIKVKTLDLKSYELKAAQQRQLQQAGLSSQDELRKAEVLEEKTRIELKQLESSQTNAERATQSQLEGLALEIQILQKEKTEAQRQLELATTKADREGVLTWVVAEEGATVQKGDVVARLADLSSFRVEATVSDVHASRLRIGMPVKIRVNEQDYLEGSVSNILPTIKEGVVTFYVSLADRSNHLLRSNLRVDVFIVTGRQQRTLRIKRGAFASGAGQQDVFVIRDGVALRTPVRLGLASFDYYEVLEGLAEGDEVIISDMRDYARLKQIKVN